MPELERHNAHERGGEVDELGRVFDSALSSILSSVLYLLAEHKNALRHSMLASRARYKLIYDERDILPSGKFAIPTLRLSTGENKYTIYVKLLHVPSIGVSMYYSHGSIVVEVNPDYGYLTESLPHEVRSHGLGGMHVYTYPPASADSYLFISLNPEVYSMLSRFISSRGSFPESFTRKLSIYSEVERRVRSIPSVQSPYSSRDKWWEGIDRDVDVVVQYIDASVSAPPIPMIRCSLDVDVYRSSKAPIYLGSWCRAYADFGGRIYLVYESDSLGLAVLMHSLGRSDYFRGINMLLESTASELSRFTLISAVINKVRSELA